MSENTDPETIAREILRLDKTASPAPWCGLPDEDGPDEDTRYLQSLANPGDNLLGHDKDDTAVVWLREDGALIANYRNTAPTLAAAYMDLRAKLDAAKARIAALEAEKLRMYDEHARLVRVGNEEGHKNAAWWRGQVDAVTAQRDELREAADDVMRAAPAPTDLRLLLIGSNATPNRNSDLFDQVDKYEVARQRLRAAVDGAR